MTETVLYGPNDVRVEDAHSSAADLWMRLDDLERASGWQLKPEGACLGDVCVPMPSESRERFIRDDAGGVRFNLAELGRRLDMPVLHDAATNTWCFGESAPDRVHRMSSFEAPDFALPDLTGRIHKLSEQRGKKVFMVAWASW